MTTEKIRILVVDDHDGTVQTLSTLLRLEPDFDVVGTAGDGIAAIEQVKLNRPDVVLMDIMMPRMDGIAATEVIVSFAPETAVVMVSAQSDHEYLRKSMNVGASYFLAKPISSEELLNAIRRASEVNRLRRAQFTAPPPKPEPSANGTVIALFSPTGGVGRTTIAVNLAIAVRRASNKPTALVDFSLPFGDVGVLLNAPPTWKSFSNLVGKFSALTSRELENVLFEHGSGVRALLAPPSPEAEEQIGPEDARKVLGLLRERYSYIVVDTWPSYGETVLTVLEVADVILLPLSLELTSVKNARVFIEVGTKLGLADKVKLVVNRVDEPSGLRLQDVESGLGRKVAHTLTADEGSLRIAMNRGVPLVESHPDRKLARDFLVMGRALVGVAEPAASR